jgi:hypothetical protein
VTEVTGERGTGRSPLARLLRFLWVGNAVSWTLLIICSGGHPLTAIEWGALQITWWLNHQ